MSRFNPKYRFYELMNGIFLLEFINPKDLAMTFWRVQEFYESPNVNFMRNKFNLEEYKAWYITQSKKGTFSYANDWAGFNVPSEAIEKCYALHDERLPTDELFLNLSAKCKELSAVKGLDSYYMIGARDGDDEVLYHEIAHGLYTTNKEYRERMDIALAAVYPGHLSKMKDIIAEIGYGEDTLMDEAHAYWATGLIRTMRGNPFLEQYRPLFKEIYDSYMNSWKLPLPLFTTV